MIEHKEVPTNNNEDKISTSQIIIPEIVEKGNNPIDKFVTLVHTVSGSRNGVFMTNTVEQSTQTTEKVETTVVEQPQPFKSFATEEDFNNETAKIRGTAERKVRSELLKQLGIDSEEKLAQVKSAYENSLTEQEKINEQLKQLDVLKAELATNKAIITALSKTSNKSEQEITKLVKMAKGLVSEDCTIEQALDEVLALIDKTTEKPQVPVSQVVVTTPETSIITEENPFKDKNNIDGIMKAIKENPERARQMAKAVGYSPINW